MSFVQPLRPLVKESGRADESRLRLERDAALSLRLLELVDGGEMAVEEWRVGEPPQMLGRLQFWGVGRQKVEVDVVRHAHAQAGVPSRAVQDEDNLLVWAGADLARELG